MIYVTLSDSEKSIQSILLWHHRATSGLHARLLDERSAQSPFAVFLAMTEEEVDEFFLELDFLSILDLLSATEAALRVDFWSRVQNKVKDKLSRTFRRAAKTEGKKISLVRHILRLRVEHDPKLKSRVTAFREILKLRDWLAHGRYWTPRFGRMDFSPNDVFDVCDNLLGKCLLKTPQP